MRRDKWLACSLSAVLCFILSFAGVMCLQSAFGLEANLSHLLLGCAISAVLFSLGFTVKWWYIPLLLLIPVAGWLWYRGHLLSSVEQLLYEISAVYDRAYDCGVLYWSNSMTGGGDTTVALCAAGCIVSFVSAWTICRRKTAILAVLIAMLPLAACFVVTDSVPKTGYLYLLFLGIAVLLLCQLTRRQNVKKGNLLTVLVTVPVALALLVLFCALPQENYRGQERADRILQKVQDWAEELSEAGPAGTSTGVEQTVELDRVGRLVQTHTPVMTVHAHQSGTLYLRQQGFHMYDGTSWYNEHGNDIYEWIQWNQMEPAGEVIISTQDMHLMKFVPYYAKNTAVSELGITENVTQEYTYTFEWMELPADAPSEEIHESAGGLIFPVGTYTPDAILLPAETVTWAESVALPLIKGKGTVKEQAEAIGSYVRSLADYSRNTARMPSGETDFARWFATEAESGYCVHYATTAAVLLRAAGIQAQYVTGYVVNAQAGMAVTVYEDQAHAWVEYYDPAVGWRILESTPPEGVPSYIYIPQDTTQNGPQPSDEPMEPEQRPSEQPGQKQETESVWTVLYWMLGVLGGTLIVLVQWQLRLRWRKHVLTRGTANDQAVKLWQEVARLSRMLKQKPAQEVYLLAQKAKFSQHKLTTEELSCLTTALDSCREALKAKPWYWQPVYTILLAVY